MAGLHNLYVVADELQPPVSSNYFYFLQFLFLMAFILVANRKKETHFYYKAEDDNLEQWFSNFRCCGHLSQHPKPLRTTLFCQRFFNYWSVRFGGFFAWAPQPQEGNCRLRPAANWCHQDQMKKGQSSCNMNMSDCSSDAIKLTNGPNEWIKTDVFSWLDFGFQNTGNNVSSYVCSATESAA